MKKKTPEQAQECYERVLETITQHDSLRKTCEANGVSHGAFLKWVDEGDKARKDHYTRAMSELFDAQADELIDLGRQAAIAQSAIEVAGLRLLSDNKKWLLSKRASKKYGDKLELSGDAENPISVATLDVSKLSTSALAELMAAKNAAK